MADKNPDLPILLVDADQTRLENVLSSLKSSGLNHVVTCSDSGLVKSLLKKSGFSLILLDNTMPRFNELELLPQITSEYPHVPVIMLTAKHDPEVIVRAMKNGAFDYFAKSTNKELLVIRVERALAFNEVQRKNIDLNDSLKEAIAELKIKSQTQEDLLSKLTRSTYQLRSILDAFPAIIVLVNPKGQIAQCNDKVKHYFNIDYSHLVFRPFDDFLQKIKPQFKDPEKFLYVVNQLRSRHTNNSQQKRDYAIGVENRLNLNNDLSTPLQIITTPIHPEGKAELGALWVFKDLSDEIEAEEQLQTIVNASPVPLLISRLEDGQFLYANHKLAEMTGYPQAEILNKTTSEFYYDPSERQAIVRELEQNKKVQNHEVKFKKADGSYIWGVINLVYSHLHNQPVIVGGVSDISDQKNTIQALEKTKKDLLDTQSRLVQSEKMASLGNLVAGIAHEINNPVGAVNSSADAATRAVDKILDHITHEGCKGDPASDEKAKRIFEVMKGCHTTILEGCCRITKIVKSLKNFSRIDQAEYLSANIHEGLESTLDLVNHQFKNRIEIVRKYGSLPSIDCYPNQLNQVFMNMLVNAGQAITDKGSITIETGLEDKFAFIKISDTGRGIPQDKLGKVFDPGYTTKGVGVGTGLGLSISYNILEKHGGTISVESELGKGTAFTIRLPLKPR